MNAEQPSPRNSRIRDILNPLNAAGGYVAPHITVIAICAILVILAFTSGVLVGQHNTKAQQVAKQWASVVRAEHITVPPRLPTVSSVVFNPPTKPYGHVPYTTMDHIQNQGSVGSCQCWTYKRLYEAMFLDATGTKGSFSCLFWYVLTQSPPGSDNGSYFDQYVQLVASVGAAPSADYNWQGIPSGVPSVIPTSVYTEAAKHKYTVQVNTIANSYGGVNAVYGAMDAIQSGQQVNFDTAVFQGVGAHSFFDVDSNGGCIDTPGTSVSEVGGHATSLYSFHLNDPRSPCTNCYFGGQNQWTSRWGVGRSGHVGVEHRGYFLVSCRYVGNYGFGLVTLSPSSVKPQLTTPPLWQQPPPRKNQYASPPKGFRLKPVPIGHSLPRAIRPSWWVKDAKARDNSSIDLAHLADHWGKTYHVRPSGLLATIYAECGGLTDDPWRNAVQPCDRYGSGADVSHGSCQVTDQTVAGYRSWLTSDYLVKRYEDRASQCVHLMAEIFSSIYRYEHSVGCNLTFDMAAVAWNAGPYQPCWNFRSPSGQAYTNHVSWQGWYAYVNKRHASTVNPYARGGRGSGR